MTDHKAQDRRLDTVGARLEDELVDDSGNPADADVVSAAVDSAAEDLADAPVQDFVPLLVEHEAREELRQQGLRRPLDESDDPAEPAIEDEEADGPRLSAQQGFTQPGSA